MDLTICQEDNLISLQRLAIEGARFDLVELDGPYGAGLEAWDCLDADAYLAHYQARLPLVARVLQPWGVAFLFGYPEGCAEIKTWARQSGTLHLRRWLTWYVQSTAHEGRRVQTILVFVPPPALPLAAEFRGWLQARRRALGLTVEQAHQQTGIRPYARGGFLWFESETAGIPTYWEYQRLKDFFTVPDRYDMLNGLQSFEGLTNIDYLTVSVEKATHLNVDGLRSKPQGLYTTLFRPVVPPTPTRRALVLYGGSGNAAIAAGRLGYDVTCCETDPARAAEIARRWAVEIERRDPTPVQTWGPLFAGLGAA